MNYKSNIEQLEQSFQDLTSQLGSLKGQCSLLSSQIISSEHKIKDFDHKREIYTKSVELLTFAQQVTKEKLKAGFEQIVTYAFRYVFNGDYKLNLEFNRRGNLQELDFTVSTPTCKKAFDPIVSDAGGILDILSLALRISLLELSKPKIEGFIVLDEPFRNINGDFYLQNSLKFIKKISEKTKRQIIFMTNEKSAIEIADNLIEVTKIKEEE